MSHERTTRRRYLGALGAALAGGFAGCADALGGQNGGTDGSTTSREGASPAGLAADATGTDAATAGADDPLANATEGPPAESGSDGESPYTEVYRETIQSVVLISASTDRGVGQGSGFVYSENHLVTNEHVVGDAEGIEVRFARGEWRSASVVGTDVSSDLAVIEVSDRPDYARALPLVDEEPAIGTEVVAIGNPFGRFDGSASAGIVSGTDRSIPAQNGFAIPDAIQTDAAVNPGNSGGPLVNLDSRVVGVVNSGGGENIAFAISAALVERVVSALIEDGEYEHAYVGVRLRTVTPTVAEEAGLDRPRGVLVGRVRPDGPAADTLREGDVIVGLGGNEVDTRQQLASFLALEASPGETVDVTVLRDGQRRTLELTLGDRPERTGGDLQPSIAVR
jgi:S1-C subfamily serine protease